MMNGGQSRLRTAAGRRSFFRPEALTAALALLVVCAPAMAAERSLAGIRIFSSTKAILQKYKNPSEVIVGRPSLAAQPGFGTGLSGGGGYPGGMGGAPGMGGFPGSGGLPGGGGYPGGMGGYPGANTMGGGLSLGPLPSFAGGVSPEFGGGGGGYPGAGPSSFGGFGGGGYPGGMGGAPGMGGFPGSGGLPGANGPNGTGAVSNPGEVTWIYNRANGSDLEFTMSSDGRVIQIRATGYTAPGVKTARGVVLGQTYAQVVSKYGYPESQEQLGPILTIRYTDRDHAAFQFYNQKLVAIIVAAVE